MHALKRVENSDWDYKRELRKEKTKQIEARNLNIPGHRFVVCFYHIFVFIYVYLSRTSLSSFLCFLFELTFDIDLPLDQTFGTLNDQKLFLMTHSDNMLDTL